MLVPALLALLPLAAAEDVTTLFVLGPPLRSLVASVVKVESRTTSFEVVCPSGPDKDPNCPRNDFWPPATVYVGPGNVVGGFHTGRPGVGATTAWKCNVAGGDNHALCQKTIVGPPADLTLAASTTLGECDIAGMSVAVIVTAGVEKLSGGGSTGDAATLFSSLQSRVSGLGCTMGATEAPTTTTGAHATTTYSESGGTSRPTGTTPPVTPAPSQTTTAGRTPTPNAAASWVKDVGLRYVVVEAIVGLLVLS